MSLLAVKSWVDCCGLYPQHTYGQWRWGMHAAADDGGGAGGSALCLTSDHLCNVSSITSPLSLSASAHVHIHYTLDAAPLAHSTRSLTATAHYTLLMEANFWPSVDNVPIKNLSQKIELSLFTPSLQWNGSVCNNNLNWLEIKIGAYVHPWEIVDNPTVTWYVSRTRTMSRVTDLKHNGRNAKDEHLFVDLLLELRH